VDHYTQVLLTMFAGLGRVFTPAEAAHLRATLERALREGFELSPYARVRVDYRTDEPPETSLSYHITHEILTLADVYDHWVRTRPPPLFGKHPDAKVMALAESLGPPRGLCVLDVGAGTGRNALPLARAGFAVDAVEPSAALAEILAEEVRREELAVRLLRADFLDPTLELPVERYRLALASGVISSHIRDVAQARELFERAARVLGAGGLLVFDAFLARDGYAPDAIACELSQVFWSRLFTRGELAHAMLGLPFDAVSDEPAAGFERAAALPEDWPPTPWFENWSRGRDLFDLPGDAVPMELRWLVYRKR
jgi:SAM-dependent methyltransferase